MPGRIWGAAMLVALVALCACASSSGRVRDERDLSAYSGLGTWVDLYDPQVLAHPESAVATMAERGVRTLYFETSNYQMRRDIVRPDRVGRFVDAAHARGMQIVAWYLPSFRNFTLDRRRSLAAIDFESQSGQQFDSFALDIESSVVQPVAVRTARLISLARRLRAAEPDLALGAIVPAPRGMQRHRAYWPGFPFVELAQSFDVFMPMGYFTYRSPQPRFSNAYTRLNVSLLRAATGNPELPVHAIGGIAGNASTAQVREFVKATSAEGAIGASLYDFATTSPRQWVALRAVTDG